MILHPLYEVAAKPSLLPTHPPKAINDIELFSHLTCVSHPAGRSHTPQHLLLPVYKTSSLVAMAIPWPKIRSVLPWHILSAPAVTLETASSLLVPPRRQLLYLHSSPILEQQMSRDDKGWKEKTPTGDELVGYGGDEGVSATGDALEERVARDANGDDGTRWWWRQCCS